MPSRTVCLIKIHEFCIVNTPNGKSEINVEIKMCHNNNNI